MLFFYRVELLLKWGNHFYCIYGHLFLIFLFCWRSLIFYFKYFVSIVYRVEKGIPHTRRIYNLHREYDNACFSWINIEKFWFTSVKNWIFHPILGARPNCWVPHFVDLGSDDYDFLIFNLMFFWNMDWSQVISENSSFFEFPKIF